MASSRWTHHSLLFGANSVGKTTVLEQLSYLFEARGPRPEARGPRPDRDPLSAGESPDGALWLEVEEHEANPVDADLRRRLIFAEKRRSPWEDLEPGLSELSNGESMDHALELLGDVIARSCDGTEKGDCELLAQYALSISTTFKVYQDPSLRDHRRRQLEERLAGGEAWRDTGYVLTKPIGTPVDPDDFS